MSTTFFSGETLAVDSELALQTSAAAPFHSPNGIFYFEGLSRPRVLAIFSDPEALAQDVAEAQRAFREMFLENAHPNAVAADAPWVRQALLPVVSALTAEYWQLKKSDSGIDCDEDQTFRRREEIKEDEEEID